MTQRTRSTAQATADGLRIFVAGIPWKLEEEQLRADWAECGLVEDFFLLRGPDGKSLGRFFVTYRDQEGAEAALKFNETVYGGRKIFVKKAELRERDAEKLKEPKEKKPAVEEAAPKKAFPQEKPPGCVSLCMKNLGDATSAEICKLLNDVKVQAVRLVMDRATGEPRGNAFVDFATTEEVDKAMAFNGHEVKEGYAVDMRYEIPRERPRPEGCFTVAIKKLGSHTTEKMVKHLFEGLESLKEVRLIRNKEKIQECSGLAFAEFGEAADVEAAVRRDGMSCGGQTIFVCFETKQKKEREAPKKKPREKKPKEANDTAEGEGETEKEQKKKTKTLLADGASKKDADDEAEDDDAGTETGASGGKKQASRLERRKRKRETERTEKAAAATTKSDAAGEAEEVEASGGDAPKAKRRKKKKGGVVEAAAEAPAKAAEPAGEAAPKKKKKKKVAAA